MALINYLTRIQFDFAAIALLRDELALLKITRVLIISDRGVQAAGLCDRVANSIGKDCVGAVYLGTPQNPTEAAALEAVALFKEAGCDGIVAVGGGSPIDLGKAVAILTSHEPPLEQYAFILGGLKRIGREVTPVIAVPTTAGTGSEVGRGALITLEGNRKLGFIAPALIPRVAICDPDLTAGLPSGLTAATGMDAVAHCIETYLSPAVNPVADAIALDGLKRAIAWLQMAVNDGKNRQARWNMMMAALQGALAFQKGLGAVHSMSHPLGGLSDLVLHHGTLNAVFLPAVLDFNMPFVGDKQDGLRLAMGLPAGRSVSDSIRDLNARVGIPDGLAAMGVPRDLLPEMSAKAVLDHSTASNPRPVTADDFLALYEESM